MRGHPVRAHRVQPGCTRRRRRVRRAAARHRQQGRRHGDLRRPDVQRRVAGRRGQLRARARRSRLQTAGVPCPQPGPVLLSPPRPGVPGTPRLQPDQPAAARLRHQGPLELHERRRRAGTADLPAAGRTLDGQQDPPGPGVDGTDGDHHAGRRRRRPRAVPDLRRAVLRRRGPAAHLRLGPRRLGPVRHPQQRPDRDRRGRGGGHTHDRVACHQRRRPEPDDDGHRHRDRPGRVRLAAGGACRRRVHAGTGPAVGHTHLAGQPVRAADRGVRGVDGGRRQLRLLRPRWRGIAHAPGRGPADLPCGAGDQPRGRRQEERPGRRHGRGAWQAGR